MLLAALIACALIVGITGTIVDLERTTHGLLVFLRFLPEFIGGMVLYSLYERGLPKWFAGDATLWLSIVALPLLEWLRAPNGLMYAGNDCPELYFLTGLKNITRDDNGAPAEEVLKALQSTDVKVIVIFESPYFPSAQTSPEVRAEVIRRFPQSRMAGIFHVYWRE